MFIFQLELTVNIILYQRQVYVVVVECIHFFLRVIVLVLGLRTPLSAQPPALALGFASLE